MSKEVRRRTVGYNKTHVDDKRISQLDLERLSERSGTFISPVSSSETGGGFSTSGESEGGSEGAVSECRGQACLVYHRKLCEPTQLKYIEGFVG